jgi:hypothetical protein
MEETEWALNKRRECPENKGEHLRGDDIIPDVQHLRGHGEVCLVSEGADPVIQDELDLSGLQVNGFPSTTESSQMTPYVYVPVFVRKGAVVFMKIVFMKINAF